MLHEKITSLCVSTNLSCRGIKLKGLERMRGLAATQAVDRLGNNDVGELRLCFCTSHPASPGLRLCFSTTANAEHRLTQSKLCT